MTRTALLCSSLGVALLLLLAACSQSTAHPDTLGDCRSAYGCNPPLGQPGSGGPTTSDSGSDGARDGASDGARDGGAGSDASDGATDARAD